MKQAAQRSRRSQRLYADFDISTALGSLIVALLIYIIYHIYPLISKGLFW